MEELVMTLFMLGTLSWLAKTVSKIHVRVKELERRMDER